jgi:hypothetical protein
MPAAVPLKVTLVAPERSVPLIVTSVPIGPEWGLKLAIFGGARGVTELEGVEAGPVPTSFVAVTVKVYESPFVSPVTEIGLADPTAVCPPLPGEVESAAVTV